MTMTVPDVCRFTIHGAWTNSHTVDNVIDMQVDTTGSTELRSEAIELIAADIIQNWQSQVMPVLSDNYSVLSCRWVDLDQEDGTTGEVPPDPGEPSAGGAANPSSGPQVSYLVKKVTSSARGQRSGRLYIAGVLELTHDENGVLSFGVGETPTVLQAGLRTFLENVNQPDPGPDTHQCFMVVVHLDERPPAPAEDNRVGTYTLVSDLVVDPRVATQRRRLR